MCARIVRKAYVCGRVGFHHVQNLSLTNAGAYTWICVPPLQVVGCVANELACLAGRRRGGLASLAGQPSRPARLAGPASQARWPSQPGRPRQGGHLEFILL